MKNHKFSKIGDLSALATDIKATFEKHGIKKPAFAIAFTMAPGYKTVHWVTNVSRTDGIKIMRATADKMTNKSN